MSDRDMNFILYNTGRSVSPNFNFMLRVEGLFDLPCKSVHSCKKANEYEYIQEGGLNDYVHMKRKPISKPFTFEVERYVGVDILDPLQPGTELVLPIVLMVWRRVMYKNFTPFRVYTFTGCTVMEKKYGELDAEKSGLLVETTTIGYREMMRMTMPAGVFDDFGDNFDIAEKLTPTPGKPKTDSYSHRKAIEDDKSTDAKQRIWLGFDLAKQKAAQKALEAAKKSGDADLIKQLESDPILKQTFTSTLSAIPDNRSTEATGTKFDISGYDKLTPPTEADKDKPKVEWFTNRSAHPDARSQKATGTLYDIATDEVKSAHPDNRSSDAEQRLWNGFNPDAEDPSKYDENNPAPEGTVFSVASATPDTRSTDAEGKKFIISEYKNLVPKTEEDKKKPKTDLFSNRSAHPDEKSSGATGTVYDIKTGVVKSAVSHTNPQKATPILWPGVKAGEKPPKTLRANVLRTLNSNTSTGSGSNEV